MRYVLVGVSTFSFPTNGVGSDDRFLAGESLPRQLIHDELRAAADTAVTSKYQAGDDEKHLTRAEEGVTYSLPIFLTLLRTELMLCQSRTNDHMFLAGLPAMRASIDRTKNQSGVGS